MTEEIKIIDAGKIVTHYSHAVNRKYGRKKNKPVWRKVKLHLALSGEIVGCDLEEIEENKPKKCIKHGFKNLRKLGKEND